VGDRETQSSLPASAPRYAVSMPNQLEAQQKGHVSIARKATAGLVLVIAAALAIHFVIGLIMTVFWIVVVVAAVAALLWAMKTIL